MSGTTIGGAKTVQTIKAKYGGDYYRRLGALGGAASNTGGFFGNPDRARRAGKLGGTVSRRGPAPKESFFIEDPQIDSNIIEPFARQKFWQGWFKRSK